MMKFYIPEVTDVEEVVDDADAESDRIFKLIQSRLKQIKDVNEIDNEK